MPAITVGLPPTLTAPQPATDLAFEAATVGDALLEVVARAPRLEQRVFYRGRLLVTVVLNGRQLPPATARTIELAEDDRLELLPPVAGG